MRGGGEHSLKAAVPLVALVVVALLACKSGLPADWDVPVDECAGDPQPVGPLPTECLSAPQVSQVSQVYRSTPNPVVSVLPWPGGWLIAGVNARLGAAAPDSGFWDWESLTLATMPVPAEGTDFQRTPHDLGVHATVKSTEREGDIWAGGMIELVGGRVVVTYARDVFAVTPGGQADLLSEQAPINAAALALDATRVAIAGRSAPGATSPLNYRVLDVETGSVLAQQDYSHLAGRSERQQIWVSVFTQPTAALTLFGPDKLLMAWVAPDRRAILGLLIHEDGTPWLADPVTLTRANTDLYLPHFAQVAPGRLGMVWTGDSGLEVRYRTLSEDLADSPAEGVIVNQQQRCSQEHARIAARDTGEGALIVWSTETPNPLMGRFVDSETPPHLTPQSSDALVAGNCSQGVVGPAAIGTAEAGTLLVWNEGAATSSSGPLLQQVRSSDFP